MAKTKKVKSAGRFKARYGRKIKIAIRDVETLSKKRQVCPRCKFKSAKRIANGIWECKKCGNKFAGAAYMPLPKIAVSTVHVSEIEAPDTSMEVK